MGPGHEANGVLHSSFSAPLSLDPLRVGAGAEQGAAESDAWPQGRREPSRVLDLKNSTRFA